MQGYRKLINHFDGGNAVFSANDWSGLELNFRQTPVKTLLL